VGQQVDHVSNAKACNALLIYPRFDAVTFWNFKRTAEMFAPAPPLGLITIAASPNARSLTLYLVSSGLLSQVMASCRRWQSLKN